MGLERQDRSPVYGTVWLNLPTIRKLLEYEGFYLDLITGSHHIFKYADTTFVIPVHNNRVKAIYVRKVLELIELSDREQEEEE